MIAEWPVNDRVLARSVRLAAYSRSYIAAAFTRRHPSPHLRHSGLDTSRSGRSVPIAQPIIRQTLLRRSACCFGLCNGRVL